MREVMYKVKPEVNTMNNQNRMTQRTHEQNPTPQQWLYEALYRHILWDSNLTKCFQPQVENLLELHTSNDSYQRLIHSWLWCIPVECVITLCFREKSPAWFLFLFLYPWVSHAGGDTVQKKVVRLHTVNWSLRLDCRYAELQEGKIKNVCSWNLTWLL